MQHLKTIDHNPVIYSEKFNFIQKQGICKKKFGMDDRNYCEQCQQKRSLHKAQQKYNIIY